MRLSRLMYLSHPRLSGPGDIDAIMVSSLKNNRRSTISGALLFTSDWFVQILEGDRKAVSDCLIRIASDRRHEGIEILSFDAIDERHFSDWGMTYVAHDRSSILRFRRFLPAEIFDPCAMSSRALIALAMAATRE